MTRKRLSTLSIALTAILSVGFIVPAASAVFNPEPPYDPPSGWAEESPPPPPSEITSPLRGEETAEEPGSDTPDEPTDMPNSEPAGKQDGEATSETQGKIADDQPGTPASNHKSALPPAPASDDPTPADNTPTDGQEEPSALNLIQGSWGSAPYTFDTETGVLTVTGSGDPAAPHTLGKNGTQPWIANNSSVSPSAIAKIVFADPENISFPAYSTLLFSAPSADNRLSNLESIENISRVRVNNVNDMPSMFYGAKNLTNLDVSGWNTTNVKDMGQMFQGASSLIKLDLSGWDTTNVEEMRQMFFGASSLTELNLSGWDTTNVKYMFSIFTGAGNLASLTLSSDTNLTKSANVGLVSPEGAGLTGKWVRVPSEDEVAPDPLVSWWRGSTQELLDLSGEGNAAGTYVWQKKAPVTLDLGEGDWEESVSGLEALSDAGHGDLITLPSEIPAREGFEFIGWQPAGSGPESILQGGAKFITTEALTLIAQWQSLESPRWGDAPYTFDPETGVLTVTGSGDPAAPHTLGINGTQPWEANPEIEGSQVRQIVLEEPSSIAFPPESLSLFSGDGNNWLVNLESIDGIGDVNTADVKDMINMFNGASSLVSLDIPGWDTSSVKYMGGMFQKASHLASLDISNWDTSSVEKNYGLNAMLKGADSLARLTLGPNTDLTKRGDVGLVNPPKTDAFTGNWVRIGETSPTPSKSWWSGTAPGLLARSADGNEAAVTYVWQEKAPVTLDLDGGQWDDTTPDTSSLTTAGVGDLVPVPDVAPAKDGFNFTGWVIEGSNPLRAVEPGEMILVGAAPGIRLRAVWEASGVEELTWGDAPYTFDSETGVLTIAGSGDPTAPHTLGKNGTQPWEANPEIKGLRVRQIVLEEPTSIALPSKSFLLFSATSPENRLVNLESIDGINDVITSSVEQMSNVFWGAASITSLDLSKWDTSSVETLYAMFEDMSKLSHLDVSTWDTTKVKYMAYMLKGASSLTELDLSEWVTTEVGNTNYMFAGASSLTDLDLSGWDTTHMVSMDNMFSKANSLSHLTLGATTDLTRSSDVGLVSPEGAGLTGKWVRVPSEDEVAPDPLVSWWRGSTQELLNLSGEGNAAGTYVWQEDAPITLDLNGGQWDDPTPDTRSLTTASVGDLITLPNAEPAKEGFTFTGWEQTTPTPEQPALEELFGLEHLLGLMGWDTQRDTLLTPGAQFITTSAQTLTAQWEALTPPAVAVTVSFDLAGGQGDFPPQTLTAGDECTVPTTIPTRDGYQFTGWTTNTNPPLVLQPGDTFTPAQDTTLTARWEQDTPGPDPAPGPDPKPGPDPAPGPDPKPGPDPAPGPDPKPEPAPAPTPAPTPAPSPGPAPVPAAKSKPEVTGNKPAPGTLPATGGTAAAIGAIAALLATGGTLALWANKRRTQQP